MADITLENAKKVIDAFNIPWLGYKFSVLALPMPEQILSLDVLDTVQLSALGVSQIEFPTINANVRAIPTLGNRKKYLPTSLEYSPLIMKAPSFRNRAFWTLMEKQLHALSSPVDYSSVPIMMLIVEFDTNNASVVEAFPIASWLISGAQPTSYTPASANTNATSIPMEEMRFQIDEIKRVI